MRFIKKGREPKSLRVWKRINKDSPQNLHYDNLQDSKVKEEMVSKLLSEQGGLCGYTMKGVGVDSVHIEHIYPRSLYPDKSLDWTNLIACYPKSGNCDYGAVKKGNYDPHVSPFVCPTSGGATTKFKYLQNGEVDINQLDEDARVTASGPVLNLNHKILVNDRKGKINGAIGHKPTAEAARRRALQLRRLDTGGKYEPYCEAVAQVLEAYATKLEKRAVRVKKTK